MLRYKKFIVLCCSSSFGVWDLGQVALIHGGDISIRFEMSSAAEGEGYAALDDVRITTWTYGESVDCDTLPPVSESTTRPCQEGAEFTCKMGGCIE